MKLSVVMISLVLVTISSAGPTIYKIDEEKNTAERVLNPVSSTGGEFKLLSENIMDNLMRAKCCFVFHKKFFMNRPGSLVRTQSFKFLLKARLF